MSYELRPTLIAMDDLEVAVAAARAGGDIVAQGFGSAYAADFKRRFDPVTEIDHASEAAVTAIVARERPDDVIVAEEAGGSMGVGRSWLIDPLDGTVNFVHGIPQVSVSVALWADGEPLAGVVYDPLRDECFAAERGAGTTVNGGPVAVSSTDRLDRAIVATGFPYDHGDYAEEYATVLGSVLEVVNGIRRFGSAALDLAWVAVGRYDGYWELGVAPWDQAAGIILVREAGGRVTDVAGRPSVPGTPTVLASNGILHDALAARIQLTLPARLR